VNHLQRRSVRACLRASAACLMAAVCVSCIPENDEEVEDTAVNDEAAREEPAGTEVATFGAGCFWCVEAVFLELDGVISVESGYSGGNVPNPSYDQICTGRTGHAEPNNTTRTTIATTRSRAIAASSLGRSWRSSGRSSRIS